MSEAYKSTTPATVARQDRKHSDCTTGNGKSGMAPLCTRCSTTPRTRSARTTSKIKIFLIKRKFRTRCTDGSRRAPSKNQRLEIYPEELNDKNCSTRDPAFAATDAGGVVDFTAGFYTASGANSVALKDLKHPEKPFTQAFKPGASMREIIVNSMNLPWMHFSTMSANGGSPLSSEYAHNKFHNHIGGIFDKGNSSGTMTSTQSSYDPIFWPQY